MVSVPDLDADPAVGDCPVYLCPSQLPRGEPQCLVLMVYLAGLAGRRTCGTLSLRLGEPQSDYWQLLGDPDGAGRPQCLSTRICTLGSGF